MKRLLATISALIASVLFVYPVGAIMTHGWNIGFWPNSAMPPLQWLHLFANGEVATIATMLLDLMALRSNAFHYGGLIELACIVSFPVLVFVAFSSGKVIAQHDPLAPHGAARWTNRRELKKMSSGIELGYDPASGQSVRVNVESNLVTFAPPRSGKTSGLIIPNLLATDAKSWLGPAIVIDPKAQVFKAVCARRTSLGRTVRCIDPMSLANGSDRWNPFDSINPDDISHLQRIAKVLLPQSQGSESTYFQNRASDVIVAACLAAMNSGSPSPASVAKLVSSPDELERDLADITGAVPERVRGLLAMDPKTRDPVLSTASQAFQWCDDPRMQVATETSSFDLDDICYGNTDIFVSVPADDMMALAGFMRWLLVELFATIRRGRMQSRAVIFVDEAPVVLSDMPELVRAAAEMPGAGCSLWLFYQARSQMIATIGENNAKTLLHSSEFVTLSDLPSADPDEKTFWSNALGNQSVFESSKSIDSPSGRIASTTETSKARPLLNPEEIGRLPANELIVLANSSRYAKRPSRLRKVRFDDVRFKGLVQNVSPVASTSCT